MIEKDPSNYPLATYAWVFGLSIMGGVVNFYRKLQSGHARAFNLIEFVGEITTSAFAGFIVFILAQNSDLSIGYLFALAGVAGHMGSRVIFMIESWLLKKFPIEYKDD